MGDVVKTIKDIIYSDGYHYNSDIDSENDSDSKNDSDSNNAHCISFIYKWKKKKKKKPKSHNFISTTSDFTSYCANIFCCTSTKQVWRVPIFLDGYNGKSVIARHQSSERCTTC